MPTDELHGQLDTGYPHTLRPELHKALMARGIDYRVTQGITFWNRDDGCECLAYGYKANGVPKLAIKVVGFTDPEQAIAATLGPKVTGETSDGYHTFNELYHHRAVLFSVIVRDHQELAWKSKAHYDGTMYDGMFIVGIETPKGQATYHYDIDPYWDMFDCKELDRAPEWDGHTPDEAIERIATLGTETCKLDGYTDAAFRVVQAPDETDFIDYAEVCECTACGASVIVPHEYERVSCERDELWPTYNFCPHCGAKVIAPTTNNVDVEVAE